MIYYLYRCFYGLSYDPIHKDGIVGFEITLFNVPDALKEITSIISDYNLNIHYIDTCFIAKNEYGLFIATDFTGKDSLRKELMKKFMENKYVKDVIISQRLKI